MIGERKKQGKSVILVSHALSDVAALCDRVAVLAGGRLSFLGTLTDLTAGSRPLEEAVQELFVGAVA